LENPSHSFAFVTMGYAYKLYTNLTSPNIVRLSKLLHLRTQQ